MMSATGYLGAIPLDSTTTGMHIVIQISIGTLGWANRFYSGKINNASYNTIPLNGYPVVEPPVSVVHYWCIRLETL